jgi:hypothetical protein
MNKEYEYKGVIHIHSNASDGSESFPSIIQIAKKSNIDFIILTDHNTLNGKKQAPEGWYDGVLALVGEEVSPGSNHYIALGIKEKVLPTRCPQRIIDDVKKQGGFGFIAHMDWSLHPLFFLKPHPWTSRSMNGFEGVELWSYMHDWVSRVKPWNFFKFCKNPNDLISGPHPQTLKQWDEMTKKRPVSAIGGVDAHAKHILPFKILVVLPYEILFKTIRTYVVLANSFSKNWEQAAGQLYNALSLGKCFISYDVLHNGAGFRCYVHSKDRVACFGEQIQFCKNMYFEVVSPVESDIMVVVSGEKIAQKKSKALVIPVDRAGAWRVELRLHNKPWIFGNPIYVI